MKNIGYILATLVLLSCKQAPVVNYAIVSGNIANAQTKELSLYSNTRELLKKITVAPSGSFIDTLFLENNSQLLSMYDGKNAIHYYLKTGDQLQVNYDATAFKSSLKFTGDGAEIADYLIQKDSISREKTAGGSAVYTQDEIAYTATFKDLQTTLEAAIHSIKNIDKAYQEKETRNLQYAYLHKLAIYQLYHRHFAKKPDFIISNNFLDALKGFDYNSEEDFVFSTSYGELVKNNISEQAVLLAEEHDTPVDIAFLEVTNTIENKTIKNALLYEHAKYGITYTNNLETFYTLFMEGSSNEAHKKAIQKNYNSLRTVSKGQRSPTFTNYENHAGGTTSLSDLKGKYVYIDVWATWCGPCKVEIPFLKKIEKEFHDKNIEFVSISIDRAKDYEKWKKMVTDKSLSGIQLIADKDWESDFVKNYLIKGIPRFILIDPNGIIVETNAPRPSSADLKTLLLSLEL